MDLSRYTKAERLLHQTQSGELAFDDLSDALADLIWGVLPEDDPSLAMLAGTALLGLAEWETGHRTTDSLRGLLDDLLRTKTIFDDERAPQRYRIRTGTTSRTIHSEHRVETRWFGELRGAVFAS